MDRRREVGAGERCDRCAGGQQGGFGGQTVRVDGTNRLASTDTVIFYTDK